MKFALVGLLANPGRFATVLFAVTLLIGSYWAFTEGDFYGVKGVALHWFTTAGGIIILLGVFGGLKYVSPPRIYYFLGFFTVMFVLEMAGYPPLELLGWAP